MDFEQFGKKTLALVNKEIDKTLISWRKEVGLMSRDIVPLVDEFIKGSKGGKGIRGVLVVLGYQLASSVILNGVKDLSIRLRPTFVGDSSSKTPQNDIYTIAAAYEIFHTAILAHDDIIDNSLLRREQPSLYQALGGDHQGISLAICLADMGFFLAVKIISEANFPPEIKNEALKYFSAIMLDTATGEMLDVLKGSSLIVAKYKTAKYTVSGPLCLGAILGGAKANQLVKLDQFGEGLGIAFQIQDDILDQETDWIGGLKSAAIAAKKYQDRAMKVIPELTKDLKMSKLLEQMGEYLIRRIK